MQKHRHAVRENAQQRTHIGVQGQLTKQMGDRPQKVTFQIQGMHCASCEVLITGTWQRYFVKFSGVLVILLGLFSMNNGLTLTGVPFAPTTLLAQISSEHTQTAGGTLAKVVDGKQEISMKVAGLEYTPSTFYSGTGRARRMACGWQSG